MSIYINIIKIIFLYNRLIYRANEIKLSGCSSDMSIPDFFLKFFWLMCSIYESKFCKNYDIQCLKKTLSIN